MRIFTQPFQVVMALAAKADRFDANPASTPVSLKNYRHATFIVQQGAGAVGTAKLQVEACDNAAGANPVAIPFRYRATAPNGGDAFGALTDATAADGYTTVAGANKQVAVEVDASGFPEGKTFVRLKVTEVADGPVDAAVIAILSDPRICSEPMPTALA